MKIRVWTKQGQSFSPFKCLCTVQNEDGLTVFWKALKHAESFAEIKEDSVRLRERLNCSRIAAHEAVSHRQQQDDESTSSSDDTEFDEGEQAVKVIYVDNCCNCCNTLHDMFPGCLVKLDPFHWLI
jgi:hypothetical protein